MTLRQIKIKGFFITISWSIVIWTCASILFGLVRVWGVESLPSFDRVLPFQPLNLLFQMAVLGITIGISFGVMDFILDQGWLKKLAYWKMIFIKSIVQIIISIFSLSVLVFTNDQVEDIKLGLMNFIFSETSILWVIYTGIFSFFIYFLQVMKTKIGGRILTNLILGKYHNPIVETRIFMFLDMKDSTTHAEKLGHIRFSTLIQDSLNDLTPAIIKHNAEVYQYVGDEAVLTWKLKDGFENANCLQIYYTFMNTLNSRKLYYENKYGLVPFFKAGVHLGEVTVSEVGIIKREIAYHSDVLNTAARIQGKCNEFNAELLISETLKNELSDQYHLDYKQIGDISLKGKQQLVNIFKVSLNSSKFSNL